jgi:TM2 domain-containing membrane protein YozV
MHCSKCGGFVDSNARFCTSCGSPIAGPDTGMRGQFQPNSPAPPPYPNQQNNPPNPQFRPPNQPFGKRFAEGKEPFVAVLMSFFIPGLGQFYNGDIKKGGLILVISVFGLILAGIPSLIAWVYGMYDAYQVASKSTPLWD